MEHLKNILSGNTYDHWAVLLVASAILYTALEFTRSLAGRHLKRLAEKTDTIWDDLFAELVIQTRHWFLVTVAVAVCASFIELPAKPEKILRTVATIIAFGQVGLWGNLGVRQWVALKSGTTQSSLTGYKVLGILGRIFLWSIILLVTLDNLGVNVTGLVAGLGVGGIAVALAVQSILGDIFCSITILLDKPFEVGDTISVGDITGEVIQVGIKTTRLRSVHGHEVVLSNADLVGSRINNFRRMNERRVLAALGVTYGLAPDKIERIPQILREIVMAEPRARFERSHFRDFGDSALNFETVYFVLDRDYKVYMEVQQKVNLEVYRRFSKEGIEFAYPTQTVYVNQPAPTVPASGQKPRDA